MNIRILLLSGLRSQQAVRLDVKPAACSEHNVYNEFRTSTGNRSHSININAFSHSQNNRLFECDHMIKASCHCV